MMQAFEHQRARPAPQSEPHDLASAQAMPEWHWECCNASHQSRAWGPAPALMGLGIAWFLGGQLESDDACWVAAERDALQALLASQQRFSGFSFSRVDTDGKCRRFSLRGEPVFDREGRCTGHRGMGVETTEARPLNGSAVHPSLVPPSPQSAAL